MNLISNSQNHNCLICDNAIKPIIDFGKMPIANNFIEKKDFANEYFFHMQASFCENCFTFQLLDQPDPDQMFHSNYAFFSGTSSYMKHHFVNFSVLGLSIFY